MSLSKQQISIRYGLLLQDCIGEALKATAFNSFVPTKKYDDDQMTPDFLIPNDSNPTHVVEVTQTDYRNNFQRKILRYFIAVTESKIHFGPRTIAVNILFGDSNELPKSNIEAMYSFFDSNLCPYHKANDSEKPILSKLESDARELAEDEKHENVSSALKVLIGSNKKAILIIAKQVSSLLSSGSAKTHLFPLWKLEKERKKLTGVPIGDLPDAIAYKKPLLQTLFLADLDFESLAALRNFEDLSLRVQRELAIKGLLQISRDDQKQLACISLASSKTLEETRKISNSKNYASTIKINLENAGIITKSTTLTLGKKNIERWSMLPAIDRFLYSPANISLSVDFNSIVSDPLSIDLRKECLEAINADLSLIDFFEDIRSEERRIDMCDKFLNIARSSEKMIEDSMMENLDNSIYLNIRHGRCWIADLLPLYIGCSHNDFNSDIYNSSDYNESLANPYNNITTKAPRIIKADCPRRQYIRPAIKSFQRLRKSNPEITGPMSIYLLSARLLQLRMHGAISMQKFNPVHIFIRTVAKRIGATIKYSGIDNILSDLVQDVDAVGKFDVFSMQYNGMSVLVNGLYVDQYGGLDKAKEWSARGRAFPYRYQGGKITKSLKAMVFVADGPWKVESIKRLREGGWTVCRPSELFETLNAVFEIK